MQLVLDCNTHCTNLTVLGVKHAFFHIQTSEGYENNKHKLLMTVEMSIKILIRKGHCVLKVKRLPQLVPFSCLMEGGEGRQAYILKKRANTTFMG